MPLLFLLNNCGDCCLNGTLFLTTLLRDYLPDCRYDLTCRCVYVTLRCCCYVLLFVVVVITVVVRVTFTLFLRLFLLLYIAIDCSYTLLLLLCTHCC